MLPVTLQLEHRECLALGQVETKTLQSRRRIDTVRSYNPADIPCSESVEWENAMSSNRSHYREDVDDEITVTLMNATCGSTESLCISASATTLTEIADFSRAFFGLELDVEINLFCDGKRLRHDKSSLTAKAAGIKNGDVIVVMTSATGTATSTSGRALGAASSTPTTTTGTLDFSSLLAQHPTTGSMSNHAVATSSILNQQRHNLINSNNMKFQTEPVQWEKINLDDAIQYNPDPDCFAAILFASDSHPNLFKELNHRFPALAKRLRDSYENFGVAAAANVWREEMVKGSIHRAFHEVTEQSKKTEMQRKLAANPSDSEALTYFENQKNQQLIDSQYQMVMDQYPESMGRVLMLYIDTMINNVPIKAFVDSGAQMTIISKSSLSKVGLDHLIDTRFSGVAVGVGTGKLLGRVHVAPLLIQNRFFPVTLAVLESVNTNNSNQSMNEKQQDGGVDFIFGLDMLKRHRCKIDLGSNTLVIPLEDGKNLEVPFLHEKDLDVGKGGTKGFNAEASNDEVMQRMLRKEENDDDSKMKKRKDSSA